MLFRGGALLKSLDYLIKQKSYWIYFNERIVIADNEIKDDYLFQILEECRIATAEEKLSFFEGTTIAAILAFSNHSILRKYHFYFCTLKQILFLRNQSLNLQWF